MCLAVSFFDELVAHVPHLILYEAAANPEFLYILTVPILMKKFLYYVYCKRLGYYERCQYYPYNDNTSAGRAVQAARHKDQRLLAELAGYMLH